MAELSNTAAMASADFTPSYVSSRSANSLISFSRPTRIQAVTLHYLNRILDELLLHILAAAKSLATDRIKTEGILRVLGGQSGNGSGAGALLAKNAVLEAELELRGYLDGQRKEGGKMPLGLSATSRLDGTESFPFQSAYNVLRIRCQYFSTLGDLEDPDRTANGDQNIMSSDGRPIATITAGVAIYVTALLEFVAEYILQNVARVIERDNSDEASLDDLIKAMEEDEGTAYVWNKMNVRKEVNVYHDRGRQADGKVVQRPWQVPEQDQLDKAAGGNRYKRQSLTTTASSASIITPSNSARRMEGFAGRQTPDSPMDPIGAASKGNTAVQPPPLKRRTSSERGAWFLGKRRGSFRSSQDLGSTFANGAKEGRGAAILTPGDTNAGALSGSALDDDNSFDDLVLSGQTMKVSLTPNRLRSMDNADTASGDSEDAKRNTRRRPGTGSLSLLPQVQSNRSKPPLRSPTDTMSEDQNAPRPDSRATIGRPDSRRSVLTKPSAPPSAYRSIDAEGRSIVVQTPDPNIAEEEDNNHWQPADPRRKTVNVRDMVEAISGQASPTSTEMTSFAGPQLSGRESRMSLASLTSTSEGKRLTLGAAGGKVLNLFGRKSSSAAPSPNPSNGSFIASRNVSGVSDTSRSLRSNSIAASVGAADLVSAHAASLDTAALRRTGSRSPELARHVPDSDAVITPSAEDTHPTRSGLVGLYEEPKANVSTSTLSSVVQQQVRAGDQASRKVPWAYNRPPPSALQTNGRRASGPLMGRASSSQGGHSGNDHSGTATTAAATTSQTAVPPPSAWTSNGFAFDGEASSTTTAAYGNRTPIVGVSPTFGRTSPSIRTSFQGGVGGASVNKQADTARVLAQLNQKMRECQSVEECQRLVMQALAAAAAAVHQEQETHNENVTEAMKAAGLTIASSGHGGEADTAVTHTLGEDKCIETDVVETGFKGSLPAMPIVRSIVYRNLALPMAIGYDAENDDSLPSFQRQSQVAAWLLGGDEGVPEMETKARPSVSRQDTNVSSGAGHDSDFMSADERPRQVSSIGSSHDNVGQSSLGQLLSHRSSGSAARNGRIIRTDSTRKRFAQATAKAAATSGATSIAVSHTAPPSSYRHAARLSADGLTNGAPANDEIQASEDTDVEAARRISTVSSTFSTYRDAEEGSLAADSSLSATAIAAAARIT